MIFITFLSPAILSKSSLNEFEKMSMDSTDRKFAINSEFAIFIAFKISCILCNFSLNEFKRCRNSLLKKATADQVLFFKA
jgi:hypothetical protein